MTDDQTLLVLIQIIQPDGELWVRLDQIAAITTDGSFFWLMGGGSTDSFYVHPDFRKLLKEIFTRGRIELKELPDA